MSKLLSVDRAVVVLSLLERTIFHPFAAWDQLTTARHQQPFEAVMDAV
jgi:hypothetical protein